MDELARQNTHSNECLFFQSGGGVMPGPEGVLVILDCCATSVKGQTKSHCFLVAEQWQGITGPAGVPT
ncbi:hypothetical protein E2C01_013727 [Portunus trituberculatus]|uniref:Uncharacterized protein n=1 Tax=Portunus trituberculatus TaxID=210409 RepID=A0A5B7DHE6_PORTR|nr:hypothetical protein [Portunus trituberculatus]